MSPCPEMELMLYWGDKLLEEEDIRECSLIPLKMPIVEKNILRTWVSARQDCADRHHEDTRSPCPRACVDTLVRAWLIFTRLWVKYNLLTHHTKLPQRLEWALSCLASHGSRTEGEGQVRGREDTSNSLLALGLILVARTHLPWAYVSTCGRKLFLFRRIGIE